jgi:hypothetical protein
MPASEDGFQGLDIQRSPRAVNEFLEDLLQHLGLVEQIVAAVFQLPDRIVVLDIGPLFGPPQLGDLALAVAPHLPQRGRGASDQHGEDPDKGWVLGPLLARDLIFEVAGATFHPQNALLLAMRLEPPGQVPGRLPQRLAAQTRIIALPLAPKGAQAASGLPQGVVAVDDQGIHAVVSGLD